MQDVFETMQAWLSENRPFVVARVTETWGSAPRGIGASMLASQEPEVAGSVSGGCVEGAVIEAAADILKSGKPQLLDFGVSNETAWSVGLTCGGKIQVWAERHPFFAKNEGNRQVWEALANDIREHRPFVLLTILDMIADPCYALIYPDGRTIGDHFAQEPAVKEAALDAYQKSRSGKAEFENQTVFFHVFPRKDRLVLIGAVHIALPLISFANAAGFETIIIDPRKIFATPDRFPVLPDQIINEWPDAVLPELKVDEATYAVLLTHDPKIDDVALHHLLKSKAAYIGALGSHKSHKKRIARLDAAGFSDEEIQRIHGPVGLDIGAKTPAEIALSIIAQIVQVKRRAFAQ